MSKIKLSSISAMAENRAIGKDNNLLWHIPKDFQHFKRTTMGKPMVMGRKTFESLPGVLKGRTHIVITRGDYTHEEATSVKSLEDAIALGKNLAEKDGQDEIFIIGGGEIYRQSMPLIDRIYLTVVHKNYNGDTFFPEFDWDEWHISEETKHDADGNTPAFTIFTLDRKA